VDFTDNRNITAINTMTEEVWGVLAIVAGVIMLMTVKPLLHFSGFDGDSDLHFNKSTAINVIFYALKSLAIFLIFGGFIWLFS
jgi:hypothetical protein